MPVYKNEKNGTWYAMLRYKDWEGERKQKCQRGFATKREAQEWERQFQLQKQANMDMTLESFCKLYEADVRPRLKENTWLTKESIIQSKIISTVSIFLVIIFKRYFISYSGIYCWYYY